MTPRIAPLPEHDRDDEAKDLLAQLDPSIGLANVFTTLVRHPGLFRKWLPFHGRLLNGRLVVRDRELLILRTGWNCRAEYAWGQHVRIGKAAGLRLVEIERVTAGPDAPGWSAADALLLRAADELHDASRLSDETWGALASVYDERQMIEVCMVVGHYHLVAFTLNSLGVELDPGLEGFPGKG